MDKLPQDALVQDGPTLAEVKPGETVWIKGIHVDKEGCVWLQKSAEYSPDIRVEGPGVYFDIEVTHLVGGGWNVKIPKDRQPFDTRPRGRFEGICFLATEIEIVST